MEYCGAKRHQGGEPCRKAAGWGVPGVKTGRCSLHGGKTPTHIRAAEVVMARQAVASLGLRVLPSMEPEEAILDELHRAINNVAFLEALVRDLPDTPEPDVWVPAADGEDEGHWVFGAPGIYGRTRHVSGIPTGEAKPHVLVVMLNEERDRKIRVSVAAAKARISERVLELHTGTARQLAGALASFARLAGLDTSDPKVVAWGLQAMREAGGGQVGDEALQIAAGDTQPGG